MTRKIGTLLAAYLSAHKTMINGGALCAAWLSRSVTDLFWTGLRPNRPCRFGVVCRCVDQMSRCAQNSPLWHARASVAI
jgi:hypothetical protein